MVDKFFLFNSLTKNINLNNCFFKRIVIWYLYDDSNNASPIYLLFEYFIRSFSKIKLEITLTLAM